MFVFVFWVSSLCILFLFSSSFDFLVRSFLARLALFYLSSTLVLQSFFTHGVGTGASAGTVAGASASAGVCLLREHVPVIV